jgi:hypothetical protein
VSPARHTPRNIPRALVDCGCQTTVYADGSGVEIHYCKMHEAAPDLLAALRNSSAILAAAVYNLSNKSTSYDFDNGEKLRIRGLADAVRLTLDANRAAIAKATAL